MIQIPLFILNKDFTCHTKIKTLSPRMFPKFFLEICPKDSKGFRFTYGVVHKKTRRILLSRSQDMRV